MMAQEIELEIEDSRAKVLENVLVGWQGWRCDHGENDGGENRQSEKLYHTPPPIQIGTPNVSRIWRQSC